MLVALTIVQSLCLQYLMLTVITLFGQLVYFVSLVLTLLAVLTITIFIHAIVKSALFTSFSPFLVHRPALRLTIFPDLYHISQLTIGIFLCEAKLRPAFRSSRASPGFRRRRFFRFSAGAVGYPRRGYPAPA